ncbi:sugar ABC transporter ATP-binding protein [Lichenifustis flavocetrariae]|uniref:Sugar ABC transporter ATP-binding protein n=1 Tax=Lichenifustis flavocetrariae TaxID=2949735 RepID=A0AA41YV92_9HYPH|nr:sugar ABC transporter ATP-binding protein [Lichenifustis flavocetrariae]MCW6507950.1 sugar ABC transporter ATP-binding protein [Lichenifustis flavocetrariae]
MPSDPVLTLAGISKSFPGVRALSDVGFSLYPGQVTALIGENGAGKSTIVKTLTGIYLPDEGSLTVGQEAKHFSSPRDAWAAGIAAIHQETVMFDELTVAENIFTGHMPGGTLIDWAEARRRTAALLKRIDADFKPETKLKRLSVAQQHMVEIARALSHEAKVIIMDEPTAALSSHEIQELFRIVDQLKAEGHAILFISHKFDEIFRVSDRWVCLRDGEKVGEGLTRDVREPDLVRLMVGRPVDQIFPKRALTIGETVLEVEGLSNATEFEDIGFTLRRREILGFYGLVGAGRSEVMQCLFGMSRPTRGRVTLEGRPFVAKAPADAIAAGIAYVPEDRQHQGAVLPLGIRENTTLASLGAHVRYGFLSRNSERAATRMLGTRLAVKAAHWEQRLGELSGGNQQKVVIAKWLATKPKVVILDEPTKGIDVGSKAAVHDFIGELAEDGLAVILVSSELPEVMGLADRIIVMHEGQMVTAVTRGGPGWSAEAIVAAATGADHQAVAA